MKGVNLKAGNKLRGTVLLMLVIVGLSLLVSWQVSRIEENSCWETMRQITRQSRNLMEERIFSDRELLDSLATIIAGQETVDGPEVQKILDEFQPNTMISFLGLLLPDDRVMLSNEPIHAPTEILSFRDEFNRGRHISNLSVSLLDENRKILRNFVPVTKNGTVVAMLYGVVDLSSLMEQMESDIYHGSSSIYVVDGYTGDVLVDTGNAGTSKLVELSGIQVEDSSVEGILDDFNKSRSGRCVISSNVLSTSVYCYYESSSVNRWMVGISVPERAAFASSAAVNRLLTLFNAVEVSLLLIYLIWIMRSTHKEVEEKQELAERDALTGLRNRYCYEKNLPGYVSHCKDSLTCIYADANGLRELNNTKGHQAGDRMLKAVADALSSQYTDAYRIGGDEFVAFALDEAKEETRRKVNAVNRILAEKGYEVSVGICRQRMPVEMDNLVQTAERYMYQSKKRRYEQQGKDSCSYAAWS